VSNCTTVPCGLQGLAENPAFGNVEHIDRKPLSTLELNQSRVVLA
jgi:hypothetical protein